MPSRNEVTNRINSFLKQLEKEKIRRTQQQLINKVNKAVGVKYLVQSPNGTLMYAVRTPTNKNSVRKVLKY